MESKITEKVIEGLQNASKALEKSENTERAVARIENAINVGFQTVHSKIENGLFNLRNSVNQDITARNSQTMSQVMTEFKLASIEALKEHHEDKIKPIEEELKTTKEANVETQRQLDKNVNIGYGFALACSAVLTFLGFNK